MTDPNTLESRIARFEESDFEYHRERRHAALREKRADERYRAHLVALAAAEEDEANRGR